MIFDITNFRKEIEEKIEQLNKTLNHYKFKGDSHSSFMNSLLQEEINTLKWTLQLTTKYEQK